MYREKHGCNSMPPLRLPFSHKNSTLLKEKQILTQKINFHGWGGCVWWCDVAWGVPSAHSLYCIVLPLHNFVSAGSLWAGTPPCGFHSRGAIAMVQCFFVDARRSVRHGETMNKGEVIRHPARGCSRAKPRISPRGVVATCGACQIAPLQSHPGGGAWLCCRYGLACIILCNTLLRGAMTACHRLRGGILGTPSGGPRMSPTPRSAKYGATHSYNHLRGCKLHRLWSSSAPHAEWLGAARLGAETIADARLSWRR